MGLKPWPLKYLRAGNSFVLEMADCWVLRGILQEL